MVAIIFTQVDMPRSEFLQDAGLYISLVVPRETLHLGAWTDTGRPSFTLTRPCYALSPQAPWETSFVFQRSRSGGSSGHRGRHSNSFFGRKIFRWWLFSRGDEKEGLRALARAKG